jgi:hypothetical protein
MSPHDVAKISYMFWRSVGYSHEEAIAWISMQAGETSLRYNEPPVQEGEWSFPRGDHLQANGPFQHREARRKDILNGTGIDLEDPNLTLLDGLKAADWETTKGPYKRIRPGLQSCETPGEMVEYLVRNFERSKLQGRDAERRLNLFNYWDRVAKDDGWEWP